MKDNNFLFMFTDVVKNGVKNKTSLGIAVIGPIVVMIILGYIITMAGTADTLNIGVVDQDQGLRNISVASKITEELKNQDDVNVISINLDDVNNSFKDRTIDAVLVFPENFTVNVALNKSTDILLIAEGTDQ
ncbi:MAG: ABC transporter permease, partial [Eubacteriales bacterium]|nr:ABC transporter permease [Eubacteriales bacterium]